MITTECHVTHFQCFDSMGSPITPEPADAIECDSLHPVTALDFSCTDDSVPFAVTMASPSAYIDIASTSALATGLSNTFFSFFIFAIIVIMYIGWRFGIWLYRR